MDFGKAWFTKISVIWRRANHLKKLGLSQNQPREQEFEHFLEF